MKERASLRKIRLALTATVALAACPGDDIALVTASLIQSHNGVPHEAVLDRKKIEIKAPPVRVSRIPRR